MVREDIDAAVFAKLGTLAGFNTTSRRLAHFADTPAESCPALFYASGREKSVTVTGQPAVWTLEREVWIYVKTDGIAPSTLLNPLLDEICSLIDQQNPITGRNTLGIDGVSHCRIDGVIEIAEGTLADTAIAVIPLEILTA